MPTYCYKCKTCGAKFEATHKMEETWEFCPTQDSEYSPESCSNPGLGEIGKDLGRQMASQNWNIKNNPVKEGEGNFFPTPAPKIMLPESGNAPSTPSRLIVGDYAINSDVRDTSIPSPGTYYLFNPENQTRNRNLAVFAQKYKDVSPIRHYDWINEHPCKSGENSRIFIENGLRLIPDTKRQVLVHKMKNRSDSNDILEDNNQFVSNFGEIWTVRIFKGLGCVLEECDIRGMNARHPNRDIDFRFKHLETGKTFLVECMSVSGIHSEGITAKEETQKYLLNIAYKEFISNGGTLLLGTNWVLHGDVRGTRRTNMSFKSFAKMFQYLSETGNYETDFYKTRKLEGGVNIEVSGYFYELQPPRERYYLSSPEIMFSSSGWVASDCRLHQILKAKIEYKLGNSTGISEPILLFVNYMDERVEYSRFMNIDKIDLEADLFENISAILIADPRFWALEGSRPMEMHINTNANYPLPGNILERAPWATITNGGRQEPTSEIYSVLGLNEKQWKREHTDFIKQYQKTDGNFSTEKLY